MATADSTRRIAVRACIWMIALELDESPADFLDRPSVEFRLDREGGFEPGMSVLDAGLETRESRHFLHRSKLRVETVGGGTRRVVEVVEAVVGLDVDIAWEPFPQPASTTIVFHCCIGTWLRRVSAYLAGSGHSHLRTSPRSPKPSAAGDGELGDGVVPTALEVQVREPDGAGAMGVTSRHAGGAIVGLGAAVEGPHDRSELVE